MRLYEFASVGGVSAGAVATVVAPTISKPARKGKTKPKKKKKTESESEIIKR